MRTVFAMAAMSLTMAAADKPTEVKAEDLAKDYSTLKKDFDAKWKDKTVILTGTISLAKAKDTITKTEFIMVKGFKGKSDPVMIQVRIPANKDFEKLKVGDSIKVEGKVGKYSDSVYAVELSDVKVQK